jgi:hypothetical protein
MADFKFPCPDCGQRIACDDSWSGHKVQCPSCQGELVVPPSSAVALQVLNLFLASPAAQTRFRQEVDKGTALNWALSEELAASSFAVRSDWKRAPAELLLGFKERLLTCDALRAGKVTVDIGDDGDDEPLQLMISAGGKAAKSYLWDGSGKPGFHDLVFSFAQLLPPELSIYSLKAFEETDTVAYLIGPGTLWKAVRDSLAGCFDQLFASHSPAHNFQAVKAVKVKKGVETKKGVEAEKAVKAEQAVGAEKAVEAERAAKIEQAVQSDQTIQSVEGAQAKKRKSREPDWRKLWNEYGGPASHGTPEEISQSLDTLRPMSPEDLFFGKGNVLRTRAISFFLHDLDGKPLDTWLIDRNSSRLPTILYVYASAARVGALWNLYALNAFPDKKLAGHCLGRGYLIWAYFILSAMKAEKGAQECGRLLELEAVRDEERSALFRHQKAYYDLALHLHNGSQGDELNALEPMLPMLQQENWRDPEKVKAAVKAHAQTRGEQFVHDSVKWTWPATLYALARRADALDLLPRDNPFLDTPLDVSKVERSPWLEELRPLESRFRALNISF